MSFGTLDEFERAASIGLIAQCPSCYTIFECNSSNMYCELASAARDELELIPPKREPPSL